MTAPQESDLDRSKDALVAFVSYARDRGEDRIAEEFLAELLRRLPPMQVSAWVDTHRLAGQRITSTIEAAMSDAHVVLYVMTQQSIDQDHYSRNELALAESLAKPVIVLMAEPDHPDLIPPVQEHDNPPIRFAGREERAWSELERQLRGLATINGQIYLAEKKLRKLRARAADPASAKNFAQPIATLEREIAQLRERLEAGPNAADRQQEQIRVAREQESQPHDERRIGTAVRSAGEPPAVPEGQFRDRLPLIEDLERLLHDPGVRLVSLVGGEHTGKTAMVHRMWERMDAGHSLVDLEGRAYLTAHQFDQVTARSLLTRMIRLVEDREAWPELERVLREPVPWVEKLVAVLEALPPSRSIVVIDALEELLDESGELADPAVREVVEHLVMTPGHGVRVLLVGRREAAPLEERAGTLARRRGLDEGLPPEEALNLLRHLVPDWDVLKDVSPHDVDWLHRLTAGSPRALELAAGALAAEGSLVALLDRMQDLRREDEGADMAALLFRRAFREQLTRVERRTLQALAVYGRPVLPAEVDYLLQVYLPRPPDSAGALAVLHRMRLVRRDGEYFYLPPTSESGHALDALPPGSLADVGVVPPPLTRIMMLHRAAEWFAGRRVARPRHVDDLRAELAEIDLRVRAGEYEQAFELMGRLDDGYLRDWGYSTAVLPALTRIVEVPGLKRSVQVAALSLMGGVLQQQQEFGRANECFERGLELAGWLLQDEQRIVLLEQMTAGYLSQEDVSQAARTSRAAMRTAVRYLWPSSLAWAYSTRGLVMAYEGKIAKGLRRQRRAAAWLSRREQPSNRSNPVTLQVNAAWCLWLLGDYRAASRRLETAREAAAAAGDQRLKARCLLIEGQVLVELGRPGEAIAKAQQAAAIGMRAENRTLLRDATEVQTLACLCHDDEGAPAMAWRASEIARRHHCSVLGHGLAGLVAFRQGADKDDEALTAFENGHRLALRRMHDPETSFLLLDHHGLVATGLALLGDTDEYLSVAVEAYRAARMRTRARGAVATSLRLLTQFGPRADQQVIAAAKAAAAAQTK